MTAKRIIQLILNGDPNGAIALSKQPYDEISSLNSSDIAYIEPRMQNDSGHFCRLATAYENLLLAAKLKLAVLHRRGWDSGHRTGWSGVFPVPDHVIGVGEVSTHSQLEAFIQYFGRFYTECLNQTHASLAVFPTTRFLTIEAAITAVERSPNISAAILGVMEIDCAGDCNDLRLIKSAFKSASELISKSQKAFLVFAESVSIRNYLLRCGFPADRVYVYPYPAANRFGNPDRASNPSTSLHFGSMAGTRGVHNPDKLAAFLLKKTRFPVAWTVRINLELAAEELKCDAADLRQELLAANINLLESHLKDADYDRALQSLEGMLLPYGDRYQTIGSGIFLESLCAGIVPLVPANSTMYRLYQQLGGQAPAIEKLTIEGINTAFESCIREFDELQGNMNQVRHGWLSHEHGPLSWSRRVLAFVQGQS